MLHTVCFICALIRFQTVAASFSFKDRLKMRPLSVLFVKKKKRCYAETFRDDEQTQLINKSRPSALLSEACLFSTTLKTSNQSSFLFSPCLRVNERATAPQIPRERMKNRKKLPMDRTSRFSVVHKNSSPATEISFLWRCLDVQCWNFVLWTMLFTALGTSWPKRYWWIIFVI